MSSFCYDSNNNGCVGGEIQALTSWTTPVHAFPVASSSYAPPNPAINYPVTFTDKSTFCNGSGPCGALSTNRTWSWNFGGGSPGTANTQGPINVTFPAIGVYTVNLTSGDNAGSCPATPVLLNVQKAIPKWREVAPR